MHCAAGVCSPSPRRHPLFLVLEFAPCLGLQLFRARAFESKSKMGNCSSVADGAAAETVSVSVAPAEGMSGEIRRNKKFRDRLIVTAFDGSDGRPAVYTCYDAFQRGLAVARDSQCFGFRTQGAPHAEPDGKGGSKMVPTYGAFEWRTYGQIGEIVDNVGSAVAFLDLATPNDTMVRRLLADYASPTYGDDKDCLPLQFLNPEPRFG